MKNFLFVDMKKVLINFEKHDGELSTCALAFFLLISFIPASLVIISVLSFFYTTEDIAALYIDQIKNQLPTINIDILLQRIDKIVYSKRYLAFIWVPFLFWWGSFVFDIIERGLQKAFHIEEGRKYWKAKIRHFIIIIGIGVFAFVMTLISNFMVVVKNSGILEFIKQSLDGIPVFQNFLILISATPYSLSSITTLFINTLLIFIIYRFVPPKKLDSMSKFKGALFASLSYEAVKLIFSYYITEINDYTSIFGSLNTIVILMIWIWYTCFIFIIGAEMAWVIYEKNESSAEFDFPDDDEAVDA
jgi:membrane protein